MSKEYTEKEMDKAQRAKLVKDLRNLKENSGWKILRSNLEDNMEYIRDQIVTKRHAETGEMLDEDEVDMLREKYESLNDLTQSPDKLINYYNNFDEREENFDPYYSDAEEIRQAEKNG